MVELDCLEVNLVEARSKKPFKEHTDSHGQAFVEAEPDAEYYISVQKTKYTKTDLWVEYSVDGSRLIYDTFSKRPSGGKTLKGAMFVANESGLHNVAIKFVKPAIQNSALDDGSNKREGTIGIGTIEIKVYEQLKKEYEPLGNGSTEVTEKDDGPLAGCYETQNPFRSSTTVAAGQKGFDKKLLRSSKGNLSTATVLSPRKDPKPLKLPETLILPERGDLLKSFAIKYCCASGLVDEGILPKPTPCKHVLNRICTGSGNNETAISDEEIESVEPPAKKSRVEIIDLTV